MTDPFFAIGHLLLSTIEDCANLLGDVPPASFPTSKAISGLRDASWTILEQIYFPKLEEAKANASKVSKKSSSVRRGKKTH